MAAGLPDLLGLTLVRNGSYARHLRLACDGKSVVYRKRCRCCRTSFTLLPNDVVPLHTYGLALISSRLSASVDGVAARSQGFYQTHGLISDDLENQTEPLKGQSWSDRLNDLPLRPSHQLFQRWCLKWSRQAQSWLSLLLVAYTLMGGDLKYALGNSLQAFDRCPKAMRPLLLAAGLVALLRDETVRTAAGPAVLMLSCRSSHKSHRAAGRPPPQYGGDLEFDLGRLSGY